jgi:hypothetical protein
LTRILDDDVNLAVWNRQLPAHIADFSTLLLSLNEPLAESLSLEMPDDEAEPDLHGLASRFSDVQGYKGFIADLSWLVRAFACWAPGASACVCGFWTRPCARVFTSITYRCG